MVKPPVRKQKHVQAPRVRPYRLKPLPPPTKRELRHMPLYGVPRRGGLKGPTAVTRTAPPKVAKGPAQKQKIKTPPGSGQPTASQPGTGPAGKMIGRRAPFNPFDQSVINQVLAKNEKSTQGNSHSKGAITFSTGDMKYWGYMQRLKQKIESVWVYPQWAIRRGIYGELEIRFTILKNGSLGDVTVVRTSGYPVLDEAALKALRDGQPYWPLPDAWGVKSFTVDGHFLYTTFGNGIE